MSPAIIVSVLSALIRSKCGSNSFMKFASCYSLGGLYIVCSLSGLASRSPVMSKVEPSHDLVGESVKNLIYFALCELCMYTTMPPFCPPIL